MTVTGDDTNLMNVLVLRLYLDRQHRGLNESLLQPSLAYRLDGVNKDAPTLGFVLVLWQAWAPGELRRVFMVGFQTLFEAFPISIKQHQNLLTDLCWEGFLSFMRLHAPLHLIVVEVLPLVNEGLPVLVVGSIVEVLGLECGFVNHAVARVILADAMLLD